MQVLTSFRSWFATVLYNIITCRWFVVRWRFKLYTKEMSTCLCEFNEFNDFNTSVMMQFRQIFKLWNSPRDCLYSFHFIFIIPILFEIWIDLFFHFSPFLLLYYSFTEYSTSWESILNTTMTMFLLEITFIKPFHFYCNFLFDSFI